MVFKLDFLDGDVLRWELTDGGVETTRDESYTPSIYVSAHGDGSLAECGAHLRDHPLVEAVRRIQARISFRHDHDDVLQVDVARLDAVSEVASAVSGWGHAGEYRLYNVDLSREFRYCLEEDIDPTPRRRPTVLDIDVDEQQLAEPPIEVVEVRVGESRHGAADGDDGDDGDGASEAETVRGAAGDVVAAVSERVADVDPDVLRVSTAAIVPRLHEQAAEYGVEDFQLGRRPGFQQLAGESTYASYGRVGHSPARYNLPGRVLIDRSNTFMWNQTNLDGCLDLVSRSRKPLQELSWASIGNILTAIQICEARDRDVLVPWHSWRHEQFKTMGQLHAADRGGFTFAPDVGLHDDVHELDFSSLYPNIIETRNVSPEKIRCECHEGREDVPGLGYAICDERGYLPDVLKPLIEDRDAIKAELRETEDEERAAELEGQSNAIKWILVSCFGYQGFSNAKFGRIECHEAINAYAREILLEAKEVLEANGWRVVHGIVDSVWVTPREGDDQRPLLELAEEITESVGIRLEHEAHYDWVAFVPMRNSESGALTKYFGKEAGETEYKYRGIECRQRSTPQFVEDAQHDLIDCLSETRSPETVCDRLQQWVSRLRRGAVDSEALLINNRVSKSLEDYTQNTRNVAALERAQHLGLGRGAGQNVEFVVVDDSKTSMDRVRLAVEAPDSYDVAFYRTLLVRAAESVLSPLGWRADDIDAYLSSTREASLDAF